MNLKKLLIFCFFIVFCCTIKLMADAKVEQLIQQGKKYFQENEYNLAITKFKQVLIINPKNIEALTNMKIMCIRFLQEGHSFYQKNDYLKALDSYYNALQMDPKNIEALTNMIKINIERSAGYRGIRKHAQELLQCTDTYNLKAFAYNSLGYSWEKRGFYDLAIENYKQSIVLIKNDKISQKIDELSKLKGRTVMGENSWLMLDWDAGDSSSMISSDNRFTNLIQLVIPNIDVDLLGGKASLKENFWEAISGGGDKAIFKDNNYVFLTMSRYHSDPEKGLLWFDIKANKGIIAIFHYYYDGVKDGDNPSLFIASKQYKKSEIPELFNQQLATWLKQNNITVGKRRYQLAQ